MKTLIFMTVASMVLTATWAPEAHATEEAQPVTDTSSAAASVAEPEVVEEATDPAAADPSVADPAVVEPGGAKSETSEAEASAAPAVAAKAAPTVISGQQLPPSSGRPYYVRGSIAFRTLAISDEDPANDRSMSYGLEVGYRIDPSISVFGRVGLSQRFVVPSGETSGLSPEHAALIEGQPQQLITSPFLIRDSVLGGIYRHSLDVAERSLSFAHYASVVFPTSITSQDRGLYLAPDVSSRARYGVTDKLSVGVDLGIQYRFHKFAQYAGPSGLLNTQWQLGTGFAVDYNVFDLGDEWGRLDAGAGVSWSWDNTYDSHQGPDHWRQDYGWDVYGYWAARNWLSLGVSLSEGAPAVLYGRREVNLFSRDRMTLSFSVSATY